MTKFLLRYARPCIRESEFHGIIHHKALYRQDLSVDIIRALVALHGIGSIHDNI